MIPLKEEPTINAALCFSEEDEQTQLRCQAALAHAGNVVMRQRGMKIYWPTTRARC